jgi:hypothetical protein
MNRELPYKSRDLSYKKEKYMNKDNNKPSQLPNIPMSPHIKELIESSEKAIEKLKKKISRLD